jgi:hypothetical protein
VFRYGPLGMGRYFRYVVLLGHNKNYWRVMSASRSVWELRKNLLQSSNTVPLVQLRGTLLPKLGKRWTLRLIFATGTIDEVCRVRSRAWIAYNPWSRWELIGKGENQSTYARCCGTWMPFGKNVGWVFSGKLNTTRTRATRCSKSQGVFSDSCFVARLATYPWY